MEISQGEIDYGHVYPIKLLLVVSTEAPSTDGEKQERGHVYQQLQMTTLCPNASGDTLSTAD